ncbi:glycosyltransferase [Leucobacter iarius]|uniref:Glycosyltransferase n=1 Tax=Leucobacter iarius TaxID=333963 RepID=A0ABP4XFG5_9MICO
MLVFPAYRSNPFLNMLGLAPRAAGYRFLDAVSWDGLLRLLPSLQDGDVFHLHWTTPILQRAQDRAAAEQRLTRFVAELDGLRLRGVRLLWTVHNRLPHELAFRELEVDLMRAIADRADAVHVMAPDTPTVLSDIVRLDPATVRVLPHPSYAGIYDTGITREQARASFGLEDTDHATLFMGQIRPYKGIGELIAASGTAQRTDGDLVLLLAGAVAEADPDEIRTAIPAGVRAILDLAFIDDGDMDRWLRAADVMVLPYRAILNSGSVHLAATFGIPVILPDEAHLREQFGEEPWVAFFDTRDPAASIAELLSDTTLFAEVTEADFDRFNREISPFRVSRRYRMLLDELRGWPERSRA